MQLILTREDGHKVELLVGQKRFNLLGLALVLRDDARPADPNCFYLLRRFFVQVEQRVEQDALRMHDLEGPLLLSLDDDWELERDNDDCLL